LKNETPMDQTIMNVLFICGAVVAVLIIVWVVYVFRHHTKRFKIDVV
jgi:hypothetical protein